MHYDLLDLLRCPACLGALTLAVDREHNGEVESGSLACSRCAVEYAIDRFVPRFVPQQNYSTSFGFQWNTFSRTQLDSSTGQPISSGRFFAQSAWNPTEMCGRLVLDVGCGAGRFAEVSLRTGARVVAVDYSNAVNACRANLGPNPRLDVVQADVYHLPFHPAQFDFVYCFGVLQHTPDVKASFESLCAQLAPGGRIAVDVYPRIPLNAIWPKYWLRPLTMRIPPERLFTLVRRMVDLLWPVSLAIGRVRWIGSKLRHALPIANYEGLLPLSPAQLKEWAILDTFDMLAPAHDHPQSVSTVRSWFEHAAMDDVDVFRRGLVVGRGRRKERSGVVT